MATLEEPSNRPYGPPSNVISLLGRLRSRNLPDKIDLEYLRDAAISEGTVSRTLFALRFLMLINSEGRPTDALKAIHTSTDEEYRAILADTVRLAYADVFEVIDPAKDPPSQILNIFRKYTPASQRGRMVIFFLGMCREAGIATTENSAQRAAAGRRRVSGAEAGVRARPATTRAPRRPPARESTLSPALEALVMSLPATGSPLLRDQREKWIHLARAALDFLYPEQTEEAEDVGEG